MGMIFLGSIREPLTNVIKYNQSNRSNPYLSNTPAIIRATSSIRNNGSLTILVNTNQEISGNSVVDLLGKSGGSRQYEYSYY